jgi:uncharacterized iron-regulated membrane protein
MPPAKVRTSRESMIRKLIFWTHLALGITAGLAIAIMSFTGAALAFEKELVAWAERDARRVTPPAADAPRLTLDELLQRASTARPDIRIASIAVANEPRAAIALGLPGNLFVYADPYTGELREPHATRMRAFTRAMLAWHIRLNFPPGPGNLGHTLNSAANLIFLFLCFSGLILWWPRVWNARALRPSFWFVRGTSGRARDWNWHNVFGFWNLPVLVVLVASGVVLSYRWAGELVFRLAGDIPPAAASAARPAPARALSSAAGTTSTPLPSFTTLLARIAEQVPDWKHIAFRFNPPLRGNTGSGETFTAAVRATNPWPPFATTNLTLHAQTGAVLRTETFASQSAGQRARRWVRLLHTGEALGWGGQLVAGIACLAGVMLVWTGLALAWRRFFGQSPSP